MSEESDIIQSCRVSSLVGRDEQGHRGHIGKLCRSIDHGCQYGFKCTTEWSDQDMPDNIFAHLSPDCDFKFLRWILVRNIVKVQARLIRKLEM